MRKSRRSSAAGRRRFRAGAPMRSALGATATSTRSCGFLSRTIWKLRRRSRRCDRAGRCAVAAESPHLRRSAEGNAMRMKQFLFVMALALAALPVATQAETRPVVVELFTSQGCSSCPPADALLSELSQRPEVIALGFHIDYWDNLGWKDPLSSPAATARQRDYARQFGRMQVYTPQLVVDGTDEAVGSDRTAVLQALQQAKPEAQAPVAFGDKGVTVGPGKGTGKVL